MEADRNQNEKRPSPCLLRPPLGPLRLELPVQFPSEDPPRAPLQGDSRRRVSHYPRPFDVRSPVALQAAGRHRASGLQRPAELVGSVVPVMPRCAQRNAGRIVVLANAL